MRVSRGVAVGPVSRADQETVVGVPGSSVASIDRASGRRRAADNQAGRDAQIGLLAWDVERRRRASGRRHRQHERTAAWRLVVTAAPQSSVAENVAGPVTIATCALPSAHERQRTVARARVEQRRLADERHLDGAGLEDLAVDRHRGADVAGGDAHAQVRARQRRGERCAIGRARLSGSRDRADGRSRCATA